LGLVIVEPGIIIEKVKFFVSFGLIKELDINIKVEELKFSNNKGL